MSGVLRLSLIINTLQRLSASPKPLATLTTTQYSSREQSYSGGWNNYIWEGGRPWPLLVDGQGRLSLPRWDSLARQEYEQRDDWDSGAFPPAWATRYDVTQEYDKNGNRTRMHRNTVGGYESDYGNNEDLSYTYNVVNQLTAISDADDGNYSCTVTCDANNNITQIEEVQTDGPGTATLTTDFTYDWGNRLTQHKTSAFNSSQSDTWVTERDHTIDALGRTVKSGFRDYWLQDFPPSPDTLEHVYDRARMLQNYDGSTYGEPWHWAGAANQHSGPLRSPNADTASQVGYNIANEKTPQRRTFTNPTSEGDQRNLYGQGKPQAKNSSGSGSNWYLGTASEGLAAVTVNSRTMFEGTVTATDMDRATDAREKGRIGIFGTGNAYAGSFGRVTSERIGRDLNPLGRGDGSAYVGGAQNYGRIVPRLPKSNVAPGGWGNSVNNSLSGGDGDEEARREWCACMGTVCCQGTNPDDDVCCCPEVCSPICGVMSDCRGGPGGESPVEWCRNHLAEKEAECGPSPSGVGVQGGGAGGGKKECKYCIVKKSVSLRYWEFWCSDKSVTCRFDTLRSDYSLTGQYVIGKGNECKIRCAVFLDSTRKCNSLRS